MMADLFEKSKWIWCNTEPKADEYGEFYDSFCYDGGEISIALSSDSNYVMFLNGVQVSFGQYADYPYDKVYDVIDLTPCCVKGKNHLAILVWYYGTDTTSVYYPGRAGLIYDVVCNGVSVTQSSAHTLSRMSPSYANHREKIITGQMGYSYFYDATREDDWKNGNLHDFSKSVVGEQNLPLRLRPCQKLILEEPLKGVLLKKISDTAMIFDLGINTVGFLQLETDAACEQVVCVSYAEHLTDGQVQRMIGNRDFSVEVKIKKGKTDYLNPFRRLGCRYLQVTSEQKLNGIQISVRPTVYPVSERKRPRLSALQTEIYDICIRTLRLCMHEHYEDCPWREQALYCMDSRNQMLFGYYAFGETVFPRANLQLISRDRRADGLLSICFPIKMDLVIPSFSLHWFTSCAEYLRYSDDREFLSEIYPKLQSVLQIFLDRRQKEDGLVLPFDGKEYWNFYEWSDGLDEKEFFGSHFKRRMTYDLILNALLSLALQRMADISCALAVPDRYGDMAKDLNQAIFRHFYSEEKALFFDRCSDRKYSVLGNSLAILCGACPSGRAKALCESMLNDASFTPISLSMRCFFYDALLLTDCGRYRDFILQDIERIYLPMVRAGTGTVWETEKGWRDFSLAGSLCHGWSALPIYYYHILLGD